MREIPAAVGSLECLRAAIKSGADSVYFGVGELNMRSHSAENFKVEDLPEIATICKSANVRNYLTLNTIIYDDDFDEMKKILDAAKNSGVDAVIACDMAVIKYANSAGLSVHSSTQLNISNIEAVEFYSKYVDVVVLARELKLEQIRKICDGIRARNIRGPSGELVKVEIFCHGALCVSISGKCYMSLATHGFSANRGKCFQTCRRKYKVIDEEDGNELIVDNNYVMSPKDLCTIGFLDKILDSGVDILKIEGRARGADYVYTVTKTYKEAAENYFSGTYSQEKIEKWINELSKVFNRGFWHGGYYLGKELGEWANCSGSQATQKKFLIGKVVHYYDKINIAHLDIEEIIKFGDELIITGSTTGIVEFIVGEVFKNGELVEGEVKGKDVSVKVPEKVRKNDRVWLIRKIE